jgi:outer membrane protein OmpA-like peptidoglycan-associated protein
MRIRRLIPTFLLSTAAVLPAVAGQYDICLSAADSVTCIIEQAEFARQRNNEIDASMAAVVRARAFERARNAEIAASIAAVAAERTRQLEIEQNALSTRVLAVANLERNRRFAAHQNKLAADSMERVAALRKWQLAMSKTHCHSPQSRTPRCQAERAQKFAKRQNALATASMQRVKAERERQFAAARNAEINASMAAVARARASTTVAINTTHCTGYEVTPRCEAERSRDFTLALTHCKSADDTSPRCAVERDREFHIARNAEINRSVAAVASDRALQRLEAAGRYSTGRNNSVNAALSAYGSANEPLETGAIGAPELPMDPGPTPARDLKLEHRSANDPCRAAGTPLSPLQFSRGNTIDETMTPQLERLAEIAQTCPGVRIEVHGYSDGGSAFHNRAMAQARAQAITDYLIAAGVEPNRVAAIGRGRMESVLPYTKGIADARRVEFVIKDPAMDAAARRVMWDLAELLDPTYIPAVAGLSP